jgi:hypothetical protein
MKTGYDFRSREGFKAKREREERSMLASIDLQHATGMSSGLRYLGSELKCATVFKL